MELRGPRATELRGERSRLGCCSVLSALCQPIHCRSSAIHPHTLPPAPFPFSLARFSSLSIPPSLPWFLLQPSIPLVSHPSVNPSFPTRFPLLYQSHIAFISLAILPHNPSASLSQPEQQDGGALVPHFPSASLRALLHAALLAMEGARAHPGALCTPRDTPTHT